MEWITIADWPGGTVADFDKLHAEHGDPDGLVARYCGVVNGDLRIVAAWESKAAARAVLRQRARRRGGAARAED